MKKFETILVALALTLGLLAAPVLAGATFQSWDFLSSANPAGPETVSNPYGAPVATISQGWGASGYWTSYPPILGGRLGVWDLGRGLDALHPTDIGRISLAIPSGPFGPGSSCDLVVQVIYYKDISAAPTVEVSGADLTDTQSQLLSTVENWGQWWQLQTTWHLAPNTATNAIHITGAYTGSLIDEVTVSSAAVPEPATLGLLAAGCSLLLARRRTARANGR